MPRQKRTPAAADDDLPQQQPEQDVQPPSYTPRSLKLTEIPLSKLHGNPANPRPGGHDLEAIDELAASIREHGLLQPLTVRPQPAGEKGHFQILAGHRRFLALERLGATHATCAITQADDQTALALAIVENLHRLDLTEYELATAVSAMHTVLGMGVREIARRIGKSEEWTVRARDILTLHPDILAMLEEGSLSSAQAGTLLRFRDFPDLAVAIGRLAAENATPAAELARTVVPFTHALGQQRLVAQLDSHLGAFVEQVCTLCPFQAYRVLEGVSWRPRFCLNPPHLDALRAEYRERREREEAEALEAARAAATAAAPSPEAIAATAALAESAQRQAAEMRQRAETLAQQVDNDEAMDHETAEVTIAEIERLVDQADELEAAAPSPLAPNVPRISTLPYESYVRLDAHQKRPPGCGPDCQCLGKAIDYRDELIEICLQPKHFRGLERAETARRNKALRQQEGHHQLQLEAQLVAMGSPEPEDLAAIVFLIAAGCQPNDVDEALKDARIPNLEGRTFRAWSWDPDTLNQLAALPVYKLVRLAMRIITRSDARKEYTQRRLTHWWLARKEAILPPGETPA